MDGEHLDVPAGSFSVVLCGFGVFFMPDPSRAVSGSSVRSPRWLGRIVDLGGEDERWSWEDDLLSDVVSQRRAVRRRSTATDDLESAAWRGVRRVVVNIEHHEGASPAPTSGWGKWSYSLRGMPSNYRNHASNAAPRGVGADRGDA